MATPSPPVDSTFWAAIIAAVVSAVIAFSILYLRELRIEPRRWFKSQEANHLQKQLEVYGSLVNLLDSFKAKGTELGIKNLPYSLNGMSDIQKFEGVFDKSHYILSNRIRGLHLKFVERENSLIADLMRDDRQIGTDLSEMHEAATKEYREIMERYLALTHVRLDRV